MHNVLNKFHVRLDHVSAVGALQPCEHQPQNRSFEVHLSGGQTISVRALADAAQQARDELIRGVDQLP
ncbi:TPA: hypothetical protein ACKQCJ_001270 [Stenotrophomonas maltophilia]|uniref:hypothetical protein n=1 Tax=Stenotrophomonas maltophilia group TaxID=995085 RepID=UPI001660D8DF|nr:hypothetical protein [Stenotrophomonas maltophilia]